MTTDITGQRFGRLTALFPTDKREFESVVWHCRCDCGNECDVRRNQLVGGRRKSCGCLHDGPREDLVGRRFGRLIVQYLQPDRRRTNCLWHCKCDCGNEVDVTTRDLKKGDTRSCGCFQADRAREGQKRVDGTSVTRILHSDRVFKNNTSGVRGVSFRKQDMKWVAYISFKGRKKTLGAFKNLDEAVRVRREAEKELYETFLEEYYANHPDERKVVSSSEGDGQSSDSAGDKVGPGETDSTPSTEIE